MTELFLKKIIPYFVHNLFRKKYGYKHFKDIPLDIKANTIYIVQEGTEPETLVFECPCGCKHPVYLNLLRDTDPHWSFEIKKKKIFIYPSVVKKTGCRSHYWIKDGIIIWCD